MDLWSLRGLGRLAPLRRTVKGLFRLYLRHGRVYRIRSGPLRGQRWFYHRAHPFWMPLGQYESETAAWLTRNVREGSIFFDVGAHAGYFTLLGSTLVGSTGRVVAFEPAPINLDVLERQVSLNELQNVDVVAVALSDRDGVAAFRVTENVANAHLEAIEIEHAATSTRSVVQVRTERLDSFIERVNLRPDVVKIDVEGAEEAVLEGSRRVVEEVRPAFLVSTHSRALQVACRDYLEAAGYKVESLSGFEHELVARPLEDRQDST